MANHLIIGFGGTGGKIIRTLRKQIYRHTGQAEVTGDLNIGYLYIDSNPEYMDLTDPSWKVMGKSVQLGANSQLLINDCDIYQILNNPSNYPGISNFLGDKKLWENVLQGVVDPTVGGQRRRLGRTLFASSINKFNTIVENKVKELENKGNADVTFHLIFGMAGGTGSGSIVDAIAQIRERYRKSGTKEYRILAYGLMPEESAASRDSTGSYHANGYAVLRELSALSTGSYLPADVSGKKEKIRLAENELIFNICYVFLNENERGKVVDVDEGVINTISDFLYQKLISVKDLGSNWADLLKYENAENGVNTPESEDGIFTRSKRFMAFGIKRITFPEEEIIEYTANSFSRQALLQLKYNHWEELEGYVDRKINHNFREEVRSLENLNRWKLSENHLKLSSPILPEHETPNRKWKTIEADWKFIIPKLKNLAQEKSAKADDWLNNFEQLCNKRFEEEYRGKGVREFYDVQAKTKKEIVKEIRQGIEKEYFESWLNGTQSLHDLQEMTHILIEYLEERKKAVDENIGKRQQKIEAIEKDINQSKKEFNKVGLLSKAVFGKHRKMANDHALTLEQLYIERTNVEACNFQKKIFPSLIEEIYDLQNLISKANAILEQAEKDFTDKVNAGLNDQGKNDINGDIVRFYDPGSTKEWVAKLNRNEDHQMQHASKIRKNLKDKLGNNHDFGTFVDRLDAVTIADELIKNAEEYATIVHDQDEDKNERVFNVNIYEKLKEEFLGNEDKMIKFASEIVKMAGCYVGGINENEKNKVDEGIPNVKTLFQQLAIVLPTPKFNLKSYEKIEEQDNSEVKFQKQLLKAFKAASPNDLQMFNFVPSDHDNKEITLISLKNLFPLRYLSHIKFLKDKYDYYIKSNPDTSFVVHLEGQPQDLPDLYSKPDVVWKAEALRNLYLALALNLVKEHTNKDTGIKGLALLRQDEDGFDLPPIEFGKNIPDAYQNISRSDAKELVGAVEKAFENGEMTHISNREALIPKIKSQVEKIRAVVSEKDFEIYNEPARSAVKVLKAPNLKVA